MLKNNDFKSFIIGFLLAMVMMLVMGSAPQLSHADTITVKLQHSGILLDTTGLISVESA